MPTLGGNIVKIHISEILIPSHFAHPTWHKIRAATEHYRRGTLWPIKVEKTASGWLLRDGYARLKGAIKAGTTEIEAELWTYADEIAEHEHQKERAAL